MACYERHVKGKAAEDGALQLLSKHGCKLIERNFRCHSGEIDLIMQENQTVLFVEVRYRKNTFYGQAQETVNYGKIRKLIKSANYFLQIRKDLAKLNGRFDIVAAYPQNNIMHFDWIKNAFGVEN